MLLPPLNDQFVGGGSFAVQNVCGQPHRGVVTNSQCPLKFPAIDVIASGASYVVSFPSIDDFSKRQRRKACQALTQQERSFFNPESRHLSVVVFGASGDLAKRKT